MEKTSFDLVGCQELLDSYSVYTLSKSTPPTLMEIAGFPHRENVYSNILAFLLDTGQAHGFGSLFVQSILAAYKKRCPDTWPGKHLALETELETVNVEREVRTGTGKRIDLVVECSEFVMCIENKIWTGLHNDLGEYRKHCEQERSDQPVLGIVLSPYRQQSDSCQISEHEFVSVTYSDLVEELLYRAGSYIDRHNTQYQYLLFDFVEQASRFGRKNTMTEDQREFLKFWREKEKKIKNIKLMQGGIWDKLRAREKAQAHMDRCEEELKQLNPSYNGLFVSWIHASRTAVFDLPKGGHINNCRVFLDVEFHPLRVSQVLGKRRGVEPVVLASRVSELCNVAFEPHCWESGDVSGRQVFHDDRSPFENEVCEAAVGNSVKILKALADLYLEQEKTLRPTN